MKKGHWVVALLVAGSTILLGSGWLSQTAAKVVAERSVARADTGYYCTRDADCDGGKCHHGENNNYCTTPSLAAAEKQAARVKPGLDHSVELAAVATWFQTR